MKNLAGDKDCDKIIREELFIAKIPVYTEEAEGEVPYSAIGKIGRWTLRRAWYYWEASVENKNEGLPLEAAMKLHNSYHPSMKIIGNSVRSGGHCGCPSPDDFGAGPDYNEELNDRLLKLGYKEEYSKLLEMSYIPITVGEVSKLCNEGKLDVKRYVDCYHIDDQVGLNEFANLIKEIEIEKIKNG